MRSKWSGLGPQLGRRDGRFLSTIGALSVVSLMIVGQHYTPSASPTLARGSTSPLAVSPDSYTVLFTQPWNSGSYSPGPWEATSGWAPCTSQGISAAGYDHYSSSGPQSNGSGTAWIDTFNPQETSCSADSGQRNLTLGVRGGSVTGWKTGLASYTMTLQWNLSGSAAAFIEGIANNGCTGVSKFFFQVFYGVWNQTGNKDLVTYTKSLTFFQGDASTAPCVTANWEEYTGTQAYQWAEYTSTTTKNTVTYSNVTFQMYHGDSYQPRTGVTVEVSDDAGLGYIYCFEVEPQIYTNELANFIGIN